MEGDLNLCQATLMSFPLALASLTTKCREASLSQQLDRSMCRKLVYLPKQTAGLSLLSREKQSVGKIPSVL